MSLLPNGRSWFTDHVPEQAFPKEALLMVAVAHLTPSPDALLSPDRHLVVVRSTPVPYRAAAAVPPSTFRRRRVVAALMVASVLLVLSLAVRGVLGGPLPAPQGAGASGAVYVVQPGDTFWDIARSIRPDEDPRPVVARLVAAHGGAVLMVGERIPDPDRA